MANARPLCSEVPVPPYTAFYDAVLVVLSELVNHQPNITIKVDDRLRDAVATEAGYPPEKWPENWIRTRTDRPRGINSKINTAYRFLHHPTHRGRNGQAQGIKGKRNHWGLTEIGVKEARRLIALKTLKQKAKPKGNVTALWLSEHLKPQPGHAVPPLLKKMRFEVSKKCRISAEMGVIDDHINQFFERIIRRDALRKRIEEGKSISYSHLATFAVRSAYTDIRDSGTNPVTREMFHARTEKERAITAE